MARCCGWLIVFVLAGILLADNDPNPKWADSRLTVRSGLELWLDARVINPARTTHHRAPLKPTDPIEVWPDASGNGRNVLQATKTAQPRFIQVGDDALVRFDGKDDHLRLTGLDRSLQAATIFVIAAPHTNPGEFRGFLAANAPNRRDYESGFTIDMSFPATLEFDNLNVEGRGFGGANSLLKSAFPFGTLHVLEAVIAPDEKKVRLAVDGKPAGERPFAPGPISLNEITVGARFYTNGPGPQVVRGFLEGDIAEILIYNRVLTTEETLAVRKYLDGKYAKLRDELPKTLKLPGSVVGKGEPLVPVTPSVPVQMFVPGFTVRQLPIDLTNINNLRYRADGKLVGLAYNGNIYLLSDTDGDGSEDKVELFWESKGQITSPIGMALTPPKYPHGNGVFIPSKGKVSLVVDTDGDDKADKEIVVAQGWPALAHSVDAMGIALDKDGSIYFGLGAADFTNAYQINQQGAAQFSLKNDRGTIQKVSPDFKKREIVCTGVRFSVGMAFNRLGDLFISDQEGATWLANGNPLDELLHIQPGRHYGFPPRHPKHLPGVIDEPSVFDYGPQHQSTCGLIFNESVNGGPTFGPAAWAGDAIVCGESRGKLYRTQLVKTNAGYVAKTHLIGCLNMLTVDACVSPRGDLIVATHSGPPDWGTGPGGKGKLYRISYSDPSHPQPLATWAAGPQEVRIAFDRPLNLDHLKQLAERTKITSGPYVRAGDRFESLFPPYAVVQMQRKMPRFPVAIHGAQVAADRRTLILTTAPLREAVSYAITLPGMGRPPMTELPLPQHPQIDLDFDLSGVEATWTANEGGANWTGWLPHLDVAVAKSFTAGSAVHEALWEQMKNKGTLTLRTQLNLTDMLRPAVQPGSKIDYEWPKEQITVSFSAAQSFQVTLQKDNTHQAVANAAGRYAVSTNVSVKPGELIPIELVMKTGTTNPDLQVHWHTQEDVRPRAFPLRRLLLPWAVLEADAGATLVRQRPPELEGGSWARGRQVFFSDNAACGKCHAIHGKGGAIGPDLGNLIHRDYASVVRDIVEPSFGINPDYINYIAELKTGRVLTGAVRTQGDSLIFGDEKGVSTTVPRASIDRLEPAKKSIMPEEIVKSLGPEKMKDLLTFLLTEPPHMPLDAKAPPPPPRTKAEVHAALAGAPEPPEKTRPIHTVLVAGPKDHGPGEHDYPAWQKAWAELLSVAEQTKVTTAWQWPNADQLRDADVLVFFQHGTWTPQRAADIDAFLARGGGLVYIHWAVDGNPDGPAFAQRIGLAAGGPIRFRHGPLELGFDTGRRHPIARNFDKVKFVDESYWRLVGDRGKINVLASSKEDGQPEPQFWTLEPSKGRVFVSIPGHFNWTFDDPLFRILLLRGIAWTAREPVDRFNELVPIGARVAE